MNIGEGGKKRERGANHKRLLRIENKLRAARGKVGKGVGWMGDGH